MSDARFPSRRRPSDTTVPHLGLLGGTLATIMGLVACARPGVSRQEPVSWEARVVAAPQCTTLVAHGAVVSRSDGAVLMGTLVIRVVPFARPELLGYGRIALAPLAPLDSVSQPVVRRENGTETGITFVAALLAGRYALTAQSFGFEGRTDTVAARPGATDTVSIALEEYEDAQRNRHNCRPRGFRRVGERACVTDQISRVLVLDRARDMASPRFRFALGMPSGDSTDVSVVDDERTCDRAARVYGMNTGPPRRVVVVEAGNVYVVYDPAEPLVLGEGNQWLILDKRFRVIARMSL